MKVDYNEQLMMLENKRESKKLMKKEINEKNQVIKTLELENLNILELMTENCEKLSQLQEERLNN